MIPLNTSGTGASGQPSLQNVPGGAFGRRKHAFPEDKKKRRSLRNVPSLNLRLHQSVTRA
ncbi:hypothetical protein HMPREF3036_01051 [Sutterella sp. KLE1602]|nr:hypothetical protein HMPREF3036_01051 [Sutterella sp. KLE1602]